MILKFYANTKWLYDPNIFIPIFENYWPTLIEDEYQKEDWF